MRASNGGKEDTVRRNAQACEEATLENSTMETLQEVWQKDAFRLRCFVGDQLREAGMHHAGLAWGLPGVPIAPRQARVLREVRIVVPENASKGTDLSGDF